MNDEKSSSDLSKKQSQENSNNVIYAKFKKSPAKPIKSQQQALLIFCVVLPLCLVALIVQGLQRHLFASETTLMLDIHQFASPLFNAAATFMFDFGGFPGVALCITIVCGYFYLFRNAFTTRRNFIFFAWAMFGAMVVNWSAKLAFKRPRPELWPKLLPEYGTSFPSGHSLYAAAFASTFILLFWQTKWRWGVVGAGMVWMFLMGLSRIYLGAHYPTDVVAGWALGWAWVYAVSVGRYAFTGK